MPKSKNPGPRPRGPIALHHHVYVIELDRSLVLLDKRFRDANPDATDQSVCLYVGQTGLTPEERFANHRRGHKYCRLVREHGQRLRPDLYEDLNPMTYEASAEMEGRLATRLRQQGYAVWQR